MKCKWKAGFLLMGGLVFSSAPAMALTPLTTGGNWQLVFFRDAGTAADRVFSTQHCSTFTTTGLVSSEPTSGTWKSTGPFLGNVSVNLQGQWIQQGDHVTLFGYSVQATPIAVTMDGFFVAGNAGFMTGRYQNFGALGAAKETGAFYAQFYPTGTTPPTACPT